ncbi:MAG: NAD(P)H-hydrate dehydratase [Candidatus Thiodiazotropha sp. (ex Monitilora ramsayi)]|nr:NAD(P)H-hydrate dehydratase [Candidatus Thiodiazotropha sp. (ex Monitilora ramsayi)]
MTDELPYALYTAAQVREFDRIAIEEFAIPGKELMERAGSRAFQWMQERWSELNEIVVVCGVGNNGGDGFVVARMAKQAGLRVRVCMMGNPVKLKGDARMNADAWLEMGQEIESYNSVPGKPDLIVDALLGTGLEREVTDAWATAIDDLNRHQAPVYSLDIPSGLNSDTGRIMGTAIEASATISFIGLKQGMFTGQGPDCCGEIVFDALDLPARIYSRQLLSTRRIDWRKVSHQLLPRQRTAHKGDFGHLLVIGGGPGYPGAIRLAAEAAARTGAGLVTMATHRDHVATLNIGRPELMCRGVDDMEDLAPLIQQANAIVLGPGLGRSEWAERIYLAATGSGLPMVVDADGLNWLAKHPMRRDSRILTPHPGEAARLLGITTAEVQADRFSALDALQRRYGGDVVLKGAGTLIGTGTDHPPALCSEGNPGMATGGTGDLLAGIAGALIAQDYTEREAAELGVCLHAAAGDRAARAGEVGMLAGDLLPELRSLLNPERLGA